MGRSSLLDLPTSRRVEGRTAGRQFGDSGGTTTSDRALGAAAGALLRRWREGALLTQEELGRRAGVDARTVRRLEAGELRRPRRSTLRLLTEALDVDETGRAELRAALAGGASEPAPARTATIGPEPPRELPACRGELVGRRPELDHLLAGRKQGGGVWAVEGMPGIGKSFFALRAAHAVAQDHPDGHYFVDLQAARRRRTAPSDVLGRLLRASGVPAETVPGDVDEGAALFRSVTAGRRVLLVLDGAQELAEVEPLLPGAGPSLVVVTSRRRLVGLERTRTVVLGPVAAPDAVGLLAEAAESPGLSSDPAAAETVDLCGRIPLALQLVGSRLRSRPAWSLAALNDRLRSGARLDELDPGGRDMAAALSASVEQLAPRERRAYQLASHAPDPVLGPEAAAALFGVPTSEARTVLAELVECHLVEEPAPDRFTMHALVCEHARRERPDDADDAVRRLLDHHLVSVRAAVSVTRAGAPVAAAVPHVPTGRLSARRWLERELEGVLAGVVPARRLGRGDVVLELSALLERHLDTTGRHRAAVSLHRAAAEEAHARSDPEAESLALSRAARVLDQHGAPQEALATYRHALELARPVGSPLATGTALLGIGNRLRLQDDCDAALLVLAEAEGLARTSAVGSLLAEVLACLGHVHRQMGDDVHAARSGSHGAAHQDRPLSQPDTGS